MGNYQAFVFDKSMLKKLYFQQRENYKGENEEGEARHDEDEMIERINNRQVFTFGYMSYGLMACTSRCLCCCKKAIIKWSPYYKKHWISFQKYKRAREELLREKDVEHMIYNQRILKFMQKTQLKKRQRDIVQYFMRYVIEDKEIKKKDIARRQSTANQLLEGFEPTSDDYDRRILFEIAKRRVEVEDYHNDTSFEEDLFEEGVERPAWISEE